MIHNSRFCIERKWDAPSSDRKAVYTPKSFILHATSLHQGFPHCGRFSTAATRRCAGRVSVPLLEVRLSPLLPVIAKVGHYPTFKLIGPRLISERRSFNLMQSIRYYRVLTRVSSGYSRLGCKYQGITSPFATANAKHWHTDKHR